MDNTLVSVCMITYGHEEYIEEAINGVFNQKTNFGYELIISNDASPDNSDKIIRNYLKNVPSKGTVVYKRHDKNMGAIPNLYYTMNLCKSKYIAICEGDDYWNDPLKLQKQIDFLEANSDFAACFHDVNILFKDKVLSFSEYKQNNVNDTVYFKEVVSKDWLIPTCSFVFRKDKMILPSFYDEFNNGDFPLFCCITLNSKAHYIKEIMGAYRKNNLGSLTNTIRTFGHLKISADYIKLLNWLYKFSNQDDRAAIEARINMEIENINKQIDIYKNSRLVKLYSVLHKLLRVKNSLKSRFHLSGSTIK